ncbi:MAG: hypothetical protein HDS35_06665 [Bacteroides sp.]|nr:hypothetical protein [Bacteroides sp.]
MSSLNRYPKVYCQVAESITPVAFSGLPNSDQNKFTCSFEALIQKDSGHRLFGFSRGFLEMLVKDVDKVVNALGGQQDSSMDCLIPIANYNAVSGSFSNHRWLMVELKLNSTVAQNDKDDLEKKVNDTKALLASGDIDQDKVFVYPDVCYARKYNLFSQWKKGSNKNVYKHWQCFSPEKFQQYLLLRENLPYSPIYPIADIKITFSGLTDVYALSERLDFWKNRALAFRESGNRFEYDNILSALAHVYETSLSTLSDSEDKTLFDMEWSFLSKYL